MSKTSVATHNNDGSAPENNASDASLKDVISFFDGDYASLDAKVILRNWQSARRNNILPPYEEVVLGRVGRAGAQTALVRLIGGSQFVISSAGSAFENWIGRQANDLDIGELAPDSTRVFREALDNALATQNPVHSVAHSVRHGHVSAYDLIVFPLANRWGAPLLLAYVRERQNRYSLIDAMFAATHDGLMALAPVRTISGDIEDFQLVSLNDGAARLMERRIEDASWQRLTELLPNLSSSDIVAQLVTVLNSEGAKQFELAYPRSSGQIAHFSVSASAMGDLVAATLTDVTSIKMREESFRLLFAENPMPMFVYDPTDFRIVDVNAAAVSHYGYSRKEFLAKTILDIRPYEDRAKVQKIFKSADVPPENGDHWRHLKADGSVIEVKIYSRQVIYRGANARITAIVDVTEQRRTEARISYLAHNDSLTSLANRAFFREKLEDAMSRVQRYGEAIAVHCIDLDFFKNVNDTLGHPIGDMLLCAVSARLTKALRDTDIVARLGGDEFAIIQSPLQKPSDAGLLAERVVGILSEPYELDGHHVVISASMGIALAPSDGTEADVLLKNADMALYRAKDDGRGTYRYFEAEMDARMKVRRALEMDLRKALPAGEFNLHYQPLVSTQTGRITGFEALLRWAHPERGNVPPNDFIPLSEDIGLIVPIGEWVLREACREAMNWPEPLSVAVNISAVQFKNQKLTAVVASALANSGLAAERLEIEITESVLLKDNEANLATLHQLRALGVRISMDDFGTGYSSLSYLRSFPFDKIKIDQSFVKDMAENKGDTAIVRAVANLGSSLGISTTAEGVETADQLERLRDEGCTEVQGYFLGRPAPASGIAELLLDYEARMSA
jgi:diguanylate cyclase (GGDEF)-like protein/PAS domain S-box-containing protein